MPPWALPGSEPRKAGECEKSRPDLRLESRRAAFAAALQWNSGTSFSLDWAEVRRRGAQARVVRTRSHRTRGSIGRGEQPHYRERGSVVQRRGEYNSNARKPFRPIERRRWDNSGWVSRAVEVWKPDSGLDGEGICGNHLENDCRLVITLRGLWGNPGAIRDGAAIDWTGPVCAAA